MRFVVVLLCLFATGAHAGVPQLGPAVASYISEGPGSFLKKLLENSPLAGEAQVASQVKTLQQVQEFYGKPSGWASLGDCALNDRLGTEYYVIYHADGPLFGYATYYLRPDGGTVVTQFSFHTYASEILPRGATHAGNICGS